MYMYVYLYIFMYTEKFSSLESRLFDLSRNGSMYFKVHILCMTYNLLLCEAASAQFIMLR